MINSISLNCVKSLPKNKSTKSVLVSKDNITQFVDMFIDIVNIRAMKCSSNCQLKIKRYIFARVKKLCICFSLCKKEDVFMFDVFIHNFRLDYQY